MGTSAIGIQDEAELAKIAQEVPEAIRTSWCVYCLWASCECRKGSLLSTDDDKDCKAYTYYD